MNNFESCINRQKRIDRVVETLGNNDIIEKNLLVKDKVMNPAHYVVMLGETSSGKSTLINSILNNKILVESVKPTTGVITEIVIKDDSEESLIAINKDSSINNLEKDVFDSFSVNPIDEINRLKYIGPCKNNKYSGMRIFDTPGYGSLVDYHEDILKEFIPESDFIVYVVSYRVGLGDDDLQFLKYVRDVIGKNVEVILAINMCPKGIEPDNKRICEIKAGINESIQKDIKTFLIESNSEKNPNTEELWDYIHSKVTDEENKEELAKTLKSYQDYILGECKIKINSQIANIESKKEDIEGRINIARELLDTKQELIDTIDRGFTRIKVKAIRIIDKSAMVVKKSITDYINDESKWSKKEETITLMEHYYVPKLTSKETDNLMSYLEDEIILLDRAVEKIVNEAMSSLGEKVEISIPIYTEVMNGIINKHIGDDLQQATGEMFRKAQGKEESGSGIKTLNNTNMKRLGGVLGQDSSKLRYSNLKHFLKTIRATSLKAITKYISVFKDSIFYLYDSLTWQKKINEISLEAIDNWAKDVEYAMKKYLEKLKDTNKEEIVSLFDELTEEFNEDEKALEEISGDELIRLKNEIEFMLDKFLLISMKK